MSSAAATFAPEEGALEMEMQSLVEETTIDHHHHHNGSSNSSHRNSRRNGGCQQQQQPQLQPRSSSSYTKWAAVASLLIVILGGLVFKQQQQQQSDPNTLETDIDALPSVVGVEEEDNDATNLNNDKDGKIISNNKNKQQQKPPSKTTTPTDLPHPDEPTGYKHPDTYFSDIYIRRARKDRQAGTPYATELQQLWGAWTFVDPQQTKSQTQQQQQRLSPEAWEELAQHYPNRDVPFQDIPTTAWQRDTEYLEKFLQQGIALTERALKAILAEYGHYDITQEREEEARKTTTTDAKSYLETALQDAEPTHNAYMFNLTLLVPGMNYNWKHPPSNGGVVTPQFWDLLKRQLLHAVMTQDIFFLTMGGHSSAAGHGNHFQQSYTLQIQRALEPLLARLGVYHISRNVGMGGLGTAHNALGSASIYGGDNAILWWDSGMTENSGPHKDLFARQGMLSPDKVPLLWGNPVNYDDLTGRIRTGHWGAGYSGLPQTDSVAGIDDMPYASRYINCNGQTNSICRKDGYNGICWIEREDFEPSRKQGPMGGRAKWHPGNFVHQYNSRFVVFNIVKALREALLEWQFMENFTLPDEAWHVTPWYEKVRSAMRNDTAKDRECFQLNLPDIVCTASFQARSEMSPRANPQETSIRSILHPEVDVPEPKPNVYDPPDVYNPAFDPPDGHIDYLAIIENGNDFLPLLQRRKYLSRQIQPPPYPRKSADLAKMVSGLPAGKGWSLDAATAADLCDGTYDSFCSREANSACLLYGHNDYRGGLIGDGLSGWLLMTLKDMKHGTIMVRVIGNNVNGNTKTKGWKCENNAETCDNPLSEEEANADKGDKNTKECTDFSFEFSIDGSRTTWSKAEIDQNNIEVERLVNIYVLKNETNMSPDGTDVELGFRIGGSCGRRASFQFSHVYWA